MQSSTLFVAQSPKLGKTLAIWVISGSIVLEYFFVFYDLHSPVINDSSSVFLDFQSFFFIRVVHILSFCDLWPRNW